MGQNGPAKPAESPRLDRTRIIAVRLAATTAKGTAFAAHSASTTLESSNAL